MRWRAPSGVLLISAFAASAAWAIAHFIVFFPKQSCTISPEGASVIAEFADVAKKSGASKIVIVAHAGKDEGSQTEILRLSQCRGDAAKARLVEEGIDPARIAVSAKGDSEPQSTHFDGDLRMDRRVTLDSE